MAVDFIVMPISRYVAGDFAALGGPDAAVRRKEILPEIVGMLAPVFGDDMWDEASEAEPKLHRVDAGSFAALKEWVDATLARTQPTWVDRFRGKGRRPEDEAIAHLLGTIFAPIRFEIAKTISKYLNGIIVSADVALNQLEREMPEAAHAARATLRAALDDACASKLPMIVTS